MTLAERTPLVERLHRFADELRARGVPVSMVERIDAMRAVESAELDSPLGLHIALAATLIKSGDHLAVFDEVFDLYFRLAAPTEASPVLDLDADLQAALLDGEPSRLRRVAEQGVDRYGRFEAGRPAAGIMYQKWTEEGLRLSEAVSAAAAGDSGQARAVAENAETLREQIRDVIRQLLVADRGVDAVAKTLRTPLTADVTIASANREQLAEIMRAMVPLQTKLATTMMRKRRKRTGPPDVRATLRASMATGGVPVRVILRRPVPTKPQLFVLADMSGSVATYVAFTSSFVSAMSQLFSRLRTFAFAQNAVEVTDIFRTVRDPLAARSAVAQIPGRYGLSAMGTHTDYGHSLKQFWAEVGGQLGRRSTVLIFGDGRGNYLPSQEATLALIARRAGAVYWLNPEPKGLWDTGDSLMSVYERHCTAAVSCRSLNDLRRFIERLD